MTKDPITSSDFNYERLSAGIREHLCRVVTRDERVEPDSYVYGFNKVCMKPLPCEDHGR